MHPLLEADKVVTAAEMARIEARAYDEGERPEVFMERAGEGVAWHVQRFIEEKGLPREVIILAGKGNNGGDAYTAGIALIGLGFTVSAIQVFPLESCSPLCRERCEAFKKAGGPVKSKIEIGERGVILDGLVGTGFSGKAEGALAKAIIAANESGLPIVAVDIPSGVNGNTGEVGSVAIDADLTVYLGNPKLGFFIRQGYDHVGALTPVDYGLPTKFADKMKGEGYLFRTEAMTPLLPIAKRTQNKYTRGYVLAIGGSPGMPGAALMSCLAALRTGAGIVRLFHPSAMNAELAAAPWELIRQPFAYGDLKGILQEAKRAKSVLVGPGMGKKPAVAAFIKKLLQKIDLPLVIDADGLDAISKISPLKFPQNCIVTPHRGELMKILKIKEVEEEKLLHLAQAYADKHKVTVVYKGAPTWIFHPKSPALIFPVGDPGMATAGSGDVLTGMIAAFLSRGLLPREAASLAVSLHGIAGQVAALQHTSHCVIATDLISALPVAFKAISTII